MLNNELTNEEIYKIFGMYLMCDVQAPNPYFGDPEQAEFATAYLTGLSGLDNWQAQLQFIIDGDADESPSYEKVENCKLLLTPLEDISDDDAVEVAKMSGHLPYGWYDKSKYSVDKTDHPNRGVEVRVFDYSVRINFDKCCIYFFDYSRPNHAFVIADAMQIFQYLIGKCYDMPLFISPGHPENGKTAIELNIAIKKTNP